MLVKMQVLEYYDFVGWCSKTWRMIDEIYRGDDMHPEDIRIIGTPTCSCGAPLESQQMLLGIYQKRLLDYIGEIEDLVKVSG